MIVDSSNRCVIKSFHQQQEECAENLSSTGICSELMKGPQKIPRHRCWFGEKNYRLVLVSGGAKIHNSTKSFPNSLRKPWTWDEICSPLERKFYSESSNAARIYKVSKFKKVFRYCTYSPTGSSVDLSRQYDHYFPCRVKEVDISRWGIFSSHIILRARKSCWVLWHSPPSCLRLSTTHALHSHLVQEEKGDEKCLLLICRLQIMIIVPRKINAGPNEPTRLLIGRKLK